MLCSIKLSARPSGNPLTGLYACAKLFSTSGALLAKKKTAAGAKKDDTKPILLGRPSNNLNVRNILL